MILYVHNLSLRGTGKEGNSHHIGLLGFSERVSLELLSFNFIVYILFIYFVFDFDFSLGRLCFRMESAMEYRKLFH